jgi:hypothetical protein
MATASKKRTIYAVRTNQGVFVSSTPLRKSWLGRYTSPQYAVVCSLGFARGTGLKLRIGQQVEITIAAVRSVGARQRRAQ